jgi:hypothetical protein
VEGKYEIAVADLNAALEFPCRFHHDTILSAAHKGCLTAEKLTQESYPGGLLKRLPDHGYISTHFQEKAFTRNSSLRAEVSGTGKICAVKKDRIHGGLVSIE